MLSCKEVSDLASKKLDDKLTRWDRIGFLFHLSMCGACRGYNRYTKAIRKTLRTLGATENTPLSASVKLSDQARDRIKNTVDKALQQTYTK